MLWQILRVENGCDGCIYSVKALDGRYESAEEAEKHVPEENQWFTYFVARKVNGYDM
jgi:hypothetical protein